MATSWKPEVFVDGAWSGNGLRFERREDSDIWVRSLLGRWFVPSDGRSVESDDAPNYKLVDGHLVPLANEVTS